MSSLDTIRSSVIGAFITLVVPSAFISYVLQEEQAPHYSPHVETSVMLARHLFRNTDGLCAQLDFKSNYILDYM